MQAASMEIPLYLPESLRFRPSEWLLQVIPEFPPLFVTRQLLPEKIYNQSNYPKSAAF